MSDFAHVLLLRGMNVGGHRVTNDQLIAALGDLGRPGAAAYQASGNLLLPPHRDEPVPSAIAQGLEDAFGFAVPCLLRTAEEVRLVASWRPFTSAELESSAGKAQIIFFAEAIDKDRLTVLTDGLPDLIRIDDTDRHVAWLPRAGLLESDLDAQAIHRQVGLSTVRTHGTVHRLAKKLG